MRGPPNPEMRSPITGQGDRDKSQEDGNSTRDSKPEAFELQARTLCRRFALGYYFATAVAQLAFAGGPR